MTDKMKEEIEHYLPHDPDPTLEPGEYYYLQSTQKGEQVIKVQVKCILPGAINGEMEYGIYQAWGTGLRWVDVGWGDPNRGCYFHQLYDNKEDCRDQTHMWCDWWEELRKEQKATNDHSS